MSASSCRHSYHACGTVKASEFMHHTSGVSRLYTVRDVTSHYQCNPQFNVASPIAANRVGSPHGTSGALFNKAINYQKQPRLPYIYNTSPELLGDLTLPVESPHLFFISFVIHFNHHPIGIDYMWDHINHPSFMMVVPYMRCSRVSSPHITREATSPQLVIWVLIY